MLLNLPLPPFVLIPEVFFPFTMGNIQLTPPKDSPLGCLHKNLKALGLTNLKPKCLVFYYNMACPNTYWVTRRFGPRTDPLTIIPSSNSTFAVMVSIPYLGLVLKRSQEFNLQWGFQEFQASLITMPFQICLTSFSSLLSLTILLHLYHPLPPRL